MGSFASGFFPIPNTIDFQFVFAAASFEDNLTIYMCLIITFTIFFILLIWAIITDMRDIRQLVVPFMFDNKKDDYYLYELLVETGPLNSHSTTSNISFILSGEEATTEVRCFSDPDRHLFKSGALDSFLMSTPYPLGDLTNMKIWTDSTGLADQGAWYLFSITITDVQTGKKYRFVADQWLALDRGTFEVIFNIFY